MHADAWSEVTKIINYIGKPKHRWYVTDIDLNEVGYEVAD